MNISAATGGLGVVAMNAANQQAQVNAQVVAVALEGAKSIQQQGAATAQAAPPAAARDAAPPPPPPQNGTGQVLDVSV